MNSKPKKKPSKHKVKFKKKNKEPSAHSVISHDRGPVEPEFADYKPQKPNVYKFLCYDTHLLARQAEEEIKTMCETCDKLNIILKAEGHMDDPVITGISEKITIYAGEAWTLIHTRRLEENWYEMPH